jgi:muconolactone delta-isomerase
MKADAKLLADITAALQAKDKERLKELKSQLGRNAWLKAWRERGGSVKEFLEQPNPFIIWKDYN